MMLFIRINWQNLWGITTRFNYHVYNLIKCNYWMITLHICIILLIINDLAITCTRILNMIFFSYTIFCWVFILPSTLIVIPFSIWITFSTIKFHLELHKECFVKVLDLFILLLNQIHLNLQVLFYLEHICYKMDHQYYYIFNHIYIY